MLRMSVRSVFVSVLVGAAPLLAQKPAAKTVAGLHVPEGWEVTLQLPGGESYSGLRLYGENAYFTEHERSVPLFLSALGHA